MTYKKIAKTISPNAKKVKNTRRVFEDENYIFSIIKKEYNFTSNHFASVLIDADLQYFIPEDKLKKLKSKCSELGIYLYDVINIGITNPYIVNEKISYDISFLNMYSVDVSYKELNGEKFFIVQKKK